MPREMFIGKRFNRGSELVIKQANEIIDEYRTRGFILTVRQLYYQFVARSLIPNEQREYKRLGSIINDARLAGLIDWNMIEDRTRELVTHASWNDPESLVDVCSDQFRLDIWKDQTHRIEVWIEKGALTGVIEPVCNEYRIPYFASRGYNSQSEQWRAGKRLWRHISNRQKVLVLHLGDHDPSGIDMTRDNEDRIRLFTGSRRIELKRIALNKDQVEQYDPPPNFAKATDSRFRSYVEDYGEDSWELDALEPQVIDELIRSEIEAVWQEGPWNEILEQEAEAQKTFAAISDRWTDVTDFLNSSA